MPPRTLRMRFSAGWSLENGQSVPWPKRLVPLHCPLINFGKADHSSKVTKRAGIRNRSLPLLAKSYQGTAAPVRQSSVEFQYFPLRQRWIYSLVCLGLTRCLWPGCAVEWSTARAAFHKIFNMQHRVTVWIVMEVLFWTITSYEHPAAIEFKLYQLRIGFPE